MPTSPTGDRGLRIVDVSDPAHPSESGFYDTPGDARDVAVAGNYAYVADPAHPTEVGSYALAWTSDVAVVGNYAYVADYDSGLRIINITDPAQTREIGSYNTPGHAYNVAVAGDYAYVTDGEGGLIILRFKMHQLYVPLVLRNYQ